MYMYIHWDILGHVGKMAKFNSAPVPYVLHVCHMILKEQLGVTSVNCILIILCPILKKRGASSVKFHIVKLQRGKSTNSQLYPIGWQPADEILL